MASIYLHRPPQQACAPLPSVGQRAPTDLPLHSPRRWVLVAFLRHVGCPFAEHTVQALRAWALRHPEAAVLIVSHGDAASTQAWLQHIGGAGQAQVLCDPERRLHGQWGVGYSNLWHFAGPASLLGVVRLWPQGIYNRSASGTRWQRAATFLLDQGQVVWRHLPASAQTVHLPEGLHQGA